MEVISDCTFKEFLLNLENESLKAMLKEQSPIFPNDMVAAVDQDIK